MAREPWPGRRVDPVALVYRENLNALLRTVLVIALGLGCPAILLVLVLRGPSDPLVAWGFPPLMAYLGVYLWVLVGRPRLVVAFSRVSLLLAEVAWVVSFWFRLRGAPDVDAGWAALFPTSFMGLVVFVVVGFLVFGTWYALANVAGVLVGVLGVGLGALLTTEGGAVHVLDLVRYVVYLLVVALLLHVLSRAKARLAVAVSEAREANAQAVQATAQAEQATAEARQLREIAYLDPLTGVANRRRLVEELTHQAGLVGPDRPVAVVFFDLDEFKAVNDAHGHVVGDEVLCHVADLAARTVRAEDLVARLGGEEFVVVAPGTDRTDATRLANRVRATMPEHTAKRAGIAVTASFGVVMLRRDELATEVLDRVDRLMYEAKSSGRDRVVDAPDPGIRVTGEDEG